jgi:integrase
MLNEVSWKLRLINRSHSTGIARKFHFTRERIDGLPLPTNGQRAYYYDLKIRGLAIAVTPQGKRTFLLYRWIAGRPERVTIGPYTDLSIDQARKRAEQMNSDIALGSNPATVRRSLRAEATLEELFTAYGEDRGKELRTWNNLQSIFKCHLHAWRLRKMSSITKADVLKLQRHIAPIDPETGTRKRTYAANRTLELLSSLFNWAREHSEWKGDNPASNIPPFKERKRKRFLDGTELPAFFRALADEPNDAMRDYMLTSLLTGARRSNVQSMRWNEINWHRAEWLIPAEKAKADEDLEIVLTPVVMNILRNRKASSLSVWVFPGRGRTGHLVEPKTAWKRILRRAGLTDLRLHDLRRTLGSWQAATGASLPIIGKSLGHESIQATKIYAQLNLDPVRAAVNQATEAMLLAGGVAGLLRGKNDEI